MKLQNGNVMSRDGWEAVFICKEDLKIVCKLKSWKFLIHSIEMFWVESFLIFNYLILKFKQSYFRTIKWNFFIYDKIKHIAYFVILLIFLFLGNSFKLTLSLCLFFFNESVFSAGKKTFLKKIPKQL